MALFLGDKRRRDPRYVTIGMHQGRYKTYRDRVGYADEHERDCRRSGVDRDGGLRRSDDNNFGAKRHKLGH